MDEPDRQLVETLRAEGVALFQANQAGRSLVVQIAALMLTAIGVAVAAGISAHSDAVAIPLPPLVLLLLSYVFQQYTDVTVTGAARAAVEDRLAEALGDRRGLIYEYAVAPVRRSGPLVRSVQVLQAMTGLALLAVIGVGLVAAFEGRAWYIEVGFVIGTIFGLLSVALSYRDMLRSHELARREIEGKLKGAASAPSSGGPQGP